MSLVDLGRLLRHYWYIVFSFVIAGAIAGYVFTMMADRPPADTKYTAKSTIVVNSQAGTVVGLAQSFAEVAKSENPDISASAAVSSGTTNIVVTVIALDEHLATILAEGIANNAISQAQILFDTNQGSEFKTEFDAMVLDTIVTDSLSNNQTKSNLAKYLIIAILGGLFVGICVILAINLIRHPVLSIQSVQEITELPVLGVIPTMDTGLKLIANIRFAAQKDNPTSICLLPIGNNSLASQTKELLDAAFSFDDSIHQCPEVSAYSPIEESMVGAYAAQKAELTVIIVRQWVDSVKALQDTMMELDLARANVVGMIFAVAKNSTK